MKHRNIQTILFSTYLVIIITSFSILISWFYFWTSDVMKRNALSTLDNVGLSVQNQTDAEIQKMNEVTINVMYSDLIKENFKKYFSQLNTSTQEGSGIPGNLAGARSEQNGNELADLLTFAVGPSRAVEQLYLYDFHNKVYGNGFDNGGRSYSIADKPWYQTVLHTEGKYMPLPVPDIDMTRIVSSRELQYSISLFRLLYDKYNAPIGIIEAKQFFNTVFSSALQYEQDNTNNERILIYNQQGQVIYPLHHNAELSEPYIQYLNTKASAANEAFTAAFQNPDTKQRELLSYHRSEATGWQTVVIVSEKSLLAPFNEFSRALIIIGLAVLLFAVLLSFYAATKITRPILKIHRMIRGTSLGESDPRWNTEKKLNTRIIELDQLHDSYIQMNIRLRHSVNELLLAKEQELKAKMLALQSQMNPHFLYNTLTTISVMAEEEMNAQIVEMSGHLSDILRYISTEETDVTIGKELEQTLKYIEIHQIRHGSKLTYTCDIEDELLDLRVPKLILQPIIENALKFVAESAPPWHISIAGWLTPDGWMLEVRDNGTGFAEDMNKHWDERIAEMKRSGDILSLQIDGMGLLNIYIRLKLRYGHQAQFELFNLPSGGACVRIGGTRNTGG